MKLLGLFLIVGCASVPTAFVSTTNTMVGVKVVVENNGFQDIIVYNLLGSSKERLGRVSAAGRSVLRVRWLLESGLRLGYRDSNVQDLAWMSEELYWVELGDCVRFIVGMRPSGSYVMPCGGNSG